MQIKIKKISETAIIPTYATTGSVGCDLFSNNNDDITIKKGEIKLIPTGIALELPDEVEAQIRSRSGLAFKNGICVINSPGTIDSDYRGEIFVALINHKEQDFTIAKGMRIAQMIFNKVEIANFEISSELDASDRDVKGFGSTGV